MRQRLVVVLVAALMAGCPGRLPDDAGDGATDARSDVSRDAAADVRSDVPADLIVQPDVQVGVDVQPDVPIVMDVQADVPVVPDVPVATDVPVVPDVPVVVDVPVALDVPVVVDVPVLPDVIMVPDAVVSTDVVIPSDGGGVITGIVINEIESNMGTPGDWVELLNTGLAPVDISGLIFRDSDDTHAYPIPAGTILAPGAYFTLEEAAFGFGLGAADSARLFNTAGTTVIDSFAWTAHAAGTLGRCPNGTGAIRALNVGTKAAANDCSLGIRVNEVESSGGTPGDWVEFYNYGLTSVDVSAFIFRDSDDTHAYPLPAGTIMAPGTYFTIEEATFGFGLGAADSARLFDTAGTTLIDSHAWTAHAAGVFARCPNGTGAFMDVTMTTHNATNTPACP